MPIIEDFSNCEVISIGNPIHENLDEEVGFDPPHISLCTSLEVILSQLQTDLENGKDISEQLKVVDVLAKPMFQEFKNPSYFKEKQVQI